MSNIRKHFFFLLGAGASKPAGIPLINEFIYEFKNDLKNRSNSVDLSLLIETLEKITEKWKEINQGKDIDLETLYEILHHINRPHIIPVSLGLSKIICERGSETVFLEAELMKYIQKRCLIKTYKILEYLKPILHFLDISHRLDIMTLNYDNTIETLCTHENVSWTDGFDNKNNWNPNQFRTNLKQRKVRLFKLHGSVTWYHGPHIDTKYKRILESDPNKIGRKVGRAFTPTIDALMIYPGIGKQVVFGPYIELLSYFQELAFTSYLCIAIGYNFGDPHIKNIVLDHLHLNPKLKLIIVNPRAEDLCISLAIDARLPWRSQQKIIPVPLSIQKALQNNYLINRTNDWLLGKISNNERTVLRRAVNSFHIKFHEKKLKKTPNSFEDLWGICIDENSNCAYITQIKNGLLLKLNLDSWRWEKIASGLKRAIGIAADPSGDCLYIVEAEYQLDKNEYQLSENKKKLIKYLENKEGYGRLWRVFIDSQKYGKREPITFLGCKKCEPPIKPYQDDKSQRFWLKIPGVLRWPEAVLVEKSKKSVLVAESHRLCRINLETGSIKSALYIPLCMNLLGIIFENKSKDNVILLEAGWWELERGSIFSTTGYGRLLRGNLNNQTVNVLASGFSKARGIASVPGRNSTLIGLNHPFPNGSVCEIDIISGRVIQTWKGFNEPRDIAIMADNSHALVTTYDGLYMLKF